MDWKYFKNCLILMILMLGFLPQSSGKNISRKAINLIKDGKYKEASEFLMITKNRTANENFYLGYSFWKQEGMQHKAIPFFESALSNIDKEVGFFQHNKEASPPEAFYFLGDLYRKMGFTDLAAYNFSKYARLGMDYLLTEDAKKQVMHLSFAQILKENQRNLLVKRIIEAGSVGQDYLQGFTDDGNILVKMDSGYFSFSLEDTIAVNKQVFPFPKVNDYRTIILTDTIVFGISKEPSTWVESFDIAGYEKSLSSKETIPGKKKEYTHFTKDSSFMILEYFSSNKNYQLQVFKKNKTNNWIRQEDIEAKINTPYDERYPFIDPGSGRVYFSSDGHETMGGMDVFYIDMLDLSKKATVTNIGFPINSSADDILYRYSSAQNKSMLSSNRGAKDYDIYLVDHSKPAAQDINSKIFETLRELDLNGRNNESTQSFGDNGAVASIGNSIMNDIDNLKNATMIREVKKEVEVIMTMEIEKEVSIGYVDVNDVDNIDRLQGIEEIEVEKEIETILTEQIEVEKLVEKEVEVTELIELEKEVSIGNISASDIGSVGKVNILDDDKEVREVEVIKVEEVEKEILVGFINLKDSATVDRMYGIKEVRVGEISIEDTASVDRIYAIDEREIKLGQVTIEQVKNLDKATLELAPGLYIYNNHFNGRRNFKLKKNKELDLFLSKLSANDNDSVYIIIEASVSRYKQNNDEVLKNLAHKISDNYESYIKSKFKDNGRSVHVASSLKISGPKYAKGMKYENFEAHNNISLYGQVGNSFDPIIIKKQVKVGEIDISQVNDMDKLIGVKEINVGDINLENIQTIKYANLKINNPYAYYFTTLRKNSRINSLNRDRELNALIEKIKASEQNEFNIIITGSSSRFKSSMGKEEDLKLQRRALLNAHIYEDYLNYHLSDTGKSVTFRIEGIVDGPEYKKGIKRSEFIPYQSVSIIAK